MSLSVTLLIVIGVVMLSVFFGQILLLLGLVCRKRVNKAEDLSFAQRYLFIHDEVDCFDTKRELKEQLLKECRQIVDARNAHKKRVKATLIKIDTFLNK